MALSTPNRLTFSPGVERGEKPLNPFHVNELDAEELRELVARTLVVESVLGLRHGARLVEWEAMHGSVVAAQLAQPYTAWADELTALVTSLTAHDFSPGRARRRQTPSTWSWSRTVGEEPVGTCCIVLHTHLPWLAHHGAWPVGEEWLHQAWATSYLPLVAMLDRLAVEGRRDLLTLGLTPVLAAQLDDPYALREFHTWLGFWRTRAEGLAGRRGPAGAAGPGRGRRSHRATTAFEERWRGGDVPVLRPLVDHGDHRGARRSGHAPLPPAPRRTGGPVRTSDRPRRRRAPTGRPAPRDLGAGVRLPPRARARCTPTWESATC